MSSQWTYYSLANAPLWLRKILLLTFIPVPQHPAKSCALQFAEAIKNWHEMWCERKVCVCIFNQYVLSMSGSWGRGKQNKWQSHLASSFPTIQLSQGKRPASDWAQFGIPTSSAPSQPPPPPPSSHPLTPTHVRPPSLIHTLHSSPEEFIF